MERGYGHNGQQNKVSLADLQWFFAKSKVSISLAVTECFSFLNDLKESGILSEEESLELQADARSVSRCVYQCLCCIEEKSFPLQNLFEHLFQKPNLKKYPALKPISKEYREGRYRNRVQVTADIDKDSIIFAQDKVKICLAITDLFPFVHGLQDLTVLSERESLKLQADGRPVSRVIYECLSLIEKKDMKLSIVFEYIFQECYLKLYPGLKEILQEPCEEQAELFTGWKSCSEYRRNLLQITKTGICQAINEQFPFLYGLHDIGLLSRIQLLKLQADKSPTKDVLYKALCLIEQRNDIEALCAYAFCQFYLNLFPHLRVILQIHGGTPEVFNLWAILTHTEGLDTGKPKYMKASRLSEPPIDCGMGNWCTDGPERWLSKAIQIKSFLHKGSAV
ncbi:PREDICTED: uncharacterized protein LOC108791047 [Nanorana parkeri]|uniref:uncharacterized protein LOC108791047 n=1 Tax=Nanorana parkeri TaxID=125878 RepID=UPI000854411A|nr:PREDICTED: uncharacterized protein LOC108791047 [Nanorana parkeri]